MGRGRSSSPAPRAPASGGSRLFATKAPAAPAPAARPAAAAAAAPAAASHAPAAPAAAPSAMAPMAAPQQSGGMMSGIIGGIAQGFMFGTGSAVAHRAVDAVMGPRTIVHEQAPSKDAPAAAGAAAPAAAGAAAAAPLDGDTMVKCQFEKNQLQRCMKANDSDVDACRSYLDAMDSCKAAYRGV